jgi:hypothetical protein
MSELSNVTEQEAEELGVMKDKLMACEEPSLYILHTTTFCGA